MPRDDENGFCSHWPSFPGAFDPALWPTPSVLSTPFWGPCESRGNRNARISKTMQIAMIPPMSK